MLKCWINVVLEAGETHRLENKSQKTTNIVNNAVKDQGALIISVESFALSGY